MGIVRRFTKAYHVYDSSTYKETIRSVEKLATTSLTLFAEKSSEEQTGILEHVNDLTAKIIHVVGEDRPLIVSLALLDAIRVLDRHVQLQADQLDAKE